MPPRQKPNAGVRKRMSSIRGSSQKQGFSRRLIGRILVLTVIILLAALAALSFFTMQAFETKLAPEIGKKSASIGRSLNIQIERALGYDIPLASLRGMEAFLATILEDNTEIGYLIVTDQNDKPLYSAGPEADEGTALLFDKATHWTDSTHNEAIPLGTYYNTVVPIHKNGEIAGATHIGVPQTFVRDQLAELTYDVLTVLVVALLVAFEILAILIALRVSSPIELSEKLLKRVGAGDFRWKSTETGNDEISAFSRAMNSITRHVNELYRRLLQESEEIRAGQIDKGVIARIEERMALLRKRYTLVKPDAQEHMSVPSLASARAPLFLFVFAEELSRSFMPLYIKELYRPIPGLTGDMVIGLPIALFMFFIAVATPFAGRWVDRYGSRNIFLFAMIPAVAGFLGTAFASSIYDLLVWRSLSAIGYAMATIACQGYFARAVSVTNRAAGMAMFVGAIMVAAICGTAIGGVLADRIGYSPTFLIATGILLLSALLMATLLKHEKRDAPAGAVRTSGGLKALSLLVKNPRFVAIMLFGAIPAKIMLTGFLFYLVPLYLTQMNYSPSTIGRVMMVYFVMMVVTGPLFAKLADRARSHSIFVFFGGIASGIGVLLLPGVENIYAVVIGVFALGVGHAMNTSPLLAMIPDICDRECALLGTTTVFSLLRVIERIGSVIGPFLVGALVTTSGFSWAAASLGVITLAASLLLFLFFRIKGPRRAEETYS